MRMHQSVCLWSRLSGNRDSTTNCNILSYFPCGSKGSQECDVAYTESSNGACGIVLVQKASFEENIEGLPWNSSGISQQRVYKAKTTIKSGCGASDAAFHLWLAQELKAKDSSFTRGTK